MRTVVEMVCPNCGQKMIDKSIKVGDYFQLKCRTCEKLISFDFEEDIVNVGRLPERKQSSGVRFW